MLKVLTLSTLFPDASRPTFGGFVERQTLGLAALPDVQVEIVAPIGIPRWPFSRHERYQQFADVPEQEVWKDMIVHRPRFRTIPKIGARFMPGQMAHTIIPLLETIHDRFAFDIIDAEFFFPDGPAAMRIAQHFEIPYSIKARGADIQFWPHQHGCGAQIIASANEAAGLLAVSKALKSDMAALGIPDDKITVHYTGIDRTAFHPRDRAALQADLGIHGPLIVTVGALIERKQQQLVIKALAQLPDATLILVGDGEDRRKLEKLAASLNVADRLRMPGNLAHGDVANHLAAADVMVLPSLSEGLANAWIEALASGTPIVIGDAGGAYEVVSRPEAGAIVERDPDAIAKAVRKILSDQPDQAATADTVAEFSWDRNAKTLRDHLLKLTRAPAR